MKRLLAVAALVAAPFATVSPASAAPCLPVLCQPGPVAHCFYTTEVRFCI
jgi:hypothetical protein